MRLLLFKACSVALFALAGCGGGGSNAATSQSASNATATGTSNPSGAATASTSTGTGAASSAASPTSTSGGADPASAAQAVTPGDQTGSSASAATGSSSTGNDPATSTTLAALTAAPSAVGLSATPSALAVGLNGVLKLAASATSSANLSYQWRRNGVNLSGETARTLERIVGVSDVGARFDVVVSNSGGSTISSSVQPQVKLAPLPGEPLPTCHLQLPRPTTGTAVAELAEIDSKVQAYLTTQQTPAANLVVRYNGVVVLERGYGWQDHTCTRPMPYNGVFRLASLSKPFTKAVILKAVADGRLQFSDRIFCLQGSPSNCILDMRSESAADSRMADITVQHLFDHTSGWGNNQDPLFRDLEIANTLGTASPASRLSIARFMLRTTPLTNTPGSTFSYLNLGYQLLGLALEAKAGQSIASYAQSAVLAPLGLSTSDAMVARTLPNLRDSREPWYSDPRVDPWVNVFDVPGPLVKFPDGGTAIENLDGAGGLAFSARAYSRFMAAYWLSGLIRDGNSLSWYSFGRLPGTFSFAYQSGPIDLVLLTNQSQGDIGGPSDEAILGIIQTAVSQTSRWPTTAPAGHQP